MALEASQISVRNLVDTDFGTPLRKFTGKFDDAVPEPASGYEGTRVNLNFAAVEVIQSIEPYNFPTAVLNFGQSTRKRTKWGYFGDSLCAFMPAGEDINQQKGKRMGLIFCDGLDGRPSPKPMRQKNDAGVWEEVLAPVWIVYELEGATKGTPGVSPQDELKKLLIGKTKAEFNKVAFTLDIVRKTPELQRALTDKSFVNGLVTLGLVHEDENGVFKEGKA